MDFIVCILPLHCPRADISRLPRQGKFIMKTPCPERPGTWPGTKTKQVEEEIRCVSPQSALSNTAIVAALSVLPGRRRRVTGTLEGRRIAPRPLVTVTPDSLLYSAPSRAPIWLPHTNWRPSGKGNKLPDQRSAHRSPRDRILLVRFQHRGTSRWPHQRSEAVDSSVGIFGGRKTPA